MNQLFYICLLLVVVFSCQNESTSYIKSVDESLMPYFEAFEKEGLTRGKQIELDQIAGKIGVLESTEKVLLGQCQTLSDGSMQIVISTDFWETATSMEKEFLVFHELGHCYLGRSHDNSAIGQACKSMMYDGSGTCKLNYTSETRKNYLDELFNY